MISRSLWISLYSSQSWAGIALVEVVEHSEGKISCQEITNKGILRESTYSEANYQQAWSVRRVSASSNLSFDFHGAPPGPS